MSSAVPLTLLGGYLGAGKTTLVNDLLEQSAQRIAVLVNDFGAVNIDAKLIRTARSDSVELANGCLCCSLRDSVAETLQPLAGRGDFDRVVVEVSGVGNPAKLAPWQGFPGFAPGGLVVCADAGAIGRQLRDGFIGDTVLDQLRAAELVLLSKTDLLPEDRAKQAAQLVSQAAPQAAVLASPHGADRIAGLERWLGALPGEAGARELEPKPTPEHGGNHPFASLALRGTRPVDRERLERALAGCPQVLQRAKGFLRLQDSPQRRTLVQYSGSGLELEDCGAWSGAQEPQLVLIAAGERAEHVLAQIAAALPELQASPADGTS